MIYFTADSHYYHANIIRYEDRPYSIPGDFKEDSPNKDWVSKEIAQVRAARMTEDLLFKSNEVLTNQDDLYHLGDFTFGSADTAINLIRRLKFRRLFYIFGNHDKAMHDLHQRVLTNETRQDIVDRVVFMGDMATINVQGISIVLTHYAMKVWNKSHYGAWNLYGHSHGALPDDPHALAIDVGVDCHGYRPISFDAIKAIMAKKLWRPVDHHGERQEGGGIGLSREDYAKANRHRQYLQLKQEFEQHD